jgi:O-acetyl-ADP-ribose deacetylase
MTAPRQPYLVGSCRIELLVGDITVQEVDAIVNAANSRLAGGGGVDGAIHRAGGPAIMDETRTRYPQGCPTGSAVISGGGKLSARYVIHAVGPRWRDGKHQEPEQLAAAYRASLELAVANQCHALAFPALSAGAYGYPLPQAAEVALQTVSDFLREHHAPAEVRFVLFNDAIYAEFARALERIAEDQGKQ